MERRIFGEPGRFLAPSLLESEFKFSWFDILPRRGGGVGSHFEHRGANGGRVGHPRRLMEFAGLAASGEASGAGITPMAMGMNGFAGRELEAWSF